MALFHAKAVIDFALAGAVNGIDGFGKLSDKFEPCPWRGKLVDMGKKFDAPILKSYRAKRG
jgi:hypothetical protein